MRHADERYWPLRSETLVWYPVGLLARRTLVVSKDSRPLHLALAIGTPSVGIYWLTNLYEAGPLVQDKHRAALSARVNCPVCGAENLANRCPHDASFVDDVALEEVIGMAMQPFLDRRWRQKLIPPVVRQAMHSLRRRAVRAHAAGLKAKHVAKPQRAKDNEFFIPRCWIGATSRAFCVKVSESAKENIPTVICPVWQ